MLRALEPEDSDAFRAIRLEALQESPAAFSASFEDEVHYAPTEFLRCIGPIDVAWILGAFSTAGALIGCIGWFRERGTKVSHKSTIWGMYVTPEHRGNGIARSLVNEAIARATRVVGIRQIQLYVTVHNKVAAKLYQGLGFQRTGVRPQSLFIDGRYIDEEHYILWVRTSSDKVGTST